MAENFETKSDKGYVSFDLARFNAKNIFLNLDHKEQPRIIALCLAIRNYKRRGRPCPVVPTNELWNWVYGLRDKKKRNIVGGWFAFKYYLVIGCLMDYLKWKEVQPRGKYNPKRWNRNICLTYRGRERCKDWEELINSYSLEELDRQNTLCLYIVKKRFYS